MFIAFRKEWFDNAHYEQRMRQPHMQTKFSNTYARKAGQLRGLIIEHHVSGWFKEQYPDHYRNADNYRQWTRICSHDFKLITDSGAYRIDVSGPKKDGAFGSYSGKPKEGVDFHILCKPAAFVSWKKIDFRKGFEILGVVRAQDYHPTIDPQHIIELNQWLKQLGL